MATSAEYQNPRTLFASLTPRGRKVLGTTVALTLAVAAGVGACAGPRETGSSHTKNALSIERSCGLPEGEAKTFTLKSGGLLLQGAKIYPENPSAGVQAIIDANPQFGITNPDIVPAGEYHLPVCTPTHQPQQ